MLSVPSQLETSKSSTSTKGRKTKQKKWVATAQGWKQPITTHILNIYYLSLKKIENDRVHSLLFSNSSEMLYWEFSTVQVHKQYFYAH